MKLILAVLTLTAAYAADADLILHNGKIVTVDPGFTLRQAVAVKDGRIVAVGSNRDVLREKGAHTRVIDLAGKTVLPGLIDAHVHVEGSALSEYRGKLPVFDSIATIQKFILEKAKTAPKGAWIIVPRTLPPRLKEMRMPTRQDLDVVTDHPVAFDGSYVWSANTMALKVSGITKDTPNPSAGEVVKGPDGEPNGILRNAAHLLKHKGEQTEQFTETDRMAAMEKLLHIYAAAGLTSVADRAVGPAQVKLFEKLKAEKRLPIRLTLTWRINSTPPIEQIVADINRSPWKTNYGDEWLKMGSFKVTLDGGQSVGTAYQRQPYGPFGRQLYGQTDPDARGMLFVEPDKLFQIFRAALAKGWQLTSHVQGGAAIDILVDTFEKLDKQVQPIAPSRSHVMHGSFMSMETIQKMKRLGVTVDAQPDWLHLDGPALSRVFGLQNMRYFAPLRTFIDNGINVAGGSDHMLGYDKNLAVNPFNPFFNMWMAITRRTTEGVVIYPEEKITREEALKMYTIWAAWQEFGEKVKGSIEKGKFADLVVIDRDFMTCPIEDIRKIEPLVTMVAGKTIYSAPGVKGAWR
jgi:predicted amidohydrolase YtcJ